MRTMPEQKVKSMLAQEVDPRKALLTLDLELIESVTATDQEKRYCIYINYVKNFHILLTFSCIFHWQKNYSTVL